MKEYELLSGEKIDFSSLSDAEQEHVGEVEKLIAESVDYFEVWRRIDQPLKQGKNFTSESLRELYNSPRYKLLVDLLERYRRKTYLEK
ncbi:hypothetical protein HZA97_10025 [Candidatus Woesearchaeota archaeon]|nr:hypothetical protein [Candidatus Woesearchaeota archaeon]